MKLSLIQKLLKLGLEPETHPIEMAMLPGPVYVRIIKRIQDECGSEVGADPRALKVMAAFSRQPDFIRSPVSFSIRPNLKQTTVQVHGLN
jgi:hypothetical protein